MMRRIIDKSLNVDYNLDYIVIVPKKDEELLDAFAFTFGNTLLFNNTVEDLEYLTKFLRKNIVGQLIFVDYYPEYEEVINTLVDEHEIKFIFTKGLGELSDSEILYDYDHICDKYDNGSIHEIGFLDPFLFKVVHNKRRNTKNVMLDCHKGKAFDGRIDDTVGILNSDSSDYDSFYNELSALTFLPEYKVKVMHPSKTTVDFTSKYGLEVLSESGIENLLNGSVCNLYINFAGTNPITFIRSMDAGTPCIIGNNYFLNSYPELQGYLEMKSDDDINEMVRRIRDCIKNKDAILQNYRVFRENYSKSARSLARDFVGMEIYDDNEENHDKMLTVIVPVYNTEEYLARCLDSIIEARIPEMEVLIINDGSTDGSEGIIERYVNKHPDLFRYIKQKNGGLGHVRNVGVLEAKGKYLASVDSDDTIDAGFLRDALPLMRKDIDIIIYDWMSITKTESFETPALDPVFRRRKKVEGILYTTIMPSTCNKIIKINLFKDNNIRYLEQKFEDLSANPLALLRADTIKYIHKPYYNYYLSDNSLMRSRMDPKDMVDAIDYLNAGLDKISVVVDIDEFKYYTYSWRVEEYVINPLYELDEKELDEAIRYINRKFYKLMLDVFESEYYRAMLNKLNSKELREYIVERNEAIRKKTLKKFIRENENIQKLTPGIIYYGD